MKTLRQLKKWTLMSVLLCGISLAAYAIAPQVRVIWSTLTDITSTSAHLVVYHQGVTSFKLEICTQDGQIVGGVYLDNIGATSPEEEIFTAMDIENLQPNTTYRLKITVTGLPDENEQPNKDFRSIEFTTDAEVQP